MKQDTEDDESPSYQHELPVLLFCKCIQGYFYMANLFALYLSKYEMENVVASHPSSLVFSSFEVVFICHWNLLKYIVQVTYIIPMKKHCS